MNATYAKHAARTKILQVLAWSCNALGPSLQVLLGGIAVIFEKI